MIQSLHSGPSQSAADKLCRLLFFIGALKDAGAARVTAVTPYLCYARKDRRTKARDPVTTRYLAKLFESVGTDMIVTLDVHNPSAFENAFRCRTITATAAPLFVDYAKLLADRPLAVISPDTGGAKRAELFREALEKARGEPIGKGFTEKHRSSGVVSGVDRRGRSRRAGGRRRRWMFASGRRSTKSPPNCLGWTRAIST